VTRQTGDVSWTEEHFVVYVHDVYKTKEHGRVIEFYAEHGGMRCVPLSNLRVTAAGERSIERKRKAGAKVAA
jgi:hypothetical protein